MSNLRSKLWRSSAAGAAAIALAALLAACGGGGDAPVAQVATPAEATSYTQGAISGFGSVIVGGVRFDDTSAAVSDDDGNTKSRSDLKLGMRVEVDSGNVDRNVSTALALRIRWASEVVGPVGAIDNAASTVQVLGQTVLVTSSTVFGDGLSGGLSALSAGMVVDVHGILDPANARIVATRIDPRPGAVMFRLRGLISALNVTAKTFSVRGQTLNYASVPAAMVPAGLANGSVVALALQTTQVGGAWVASAMRTGLRLPDPRLEAHVEGVITSFASLASFEVNGLRVDASNARFPDGSAGVVLGARVEVRGVVNAGVLVATMVEIEERRNPGARLLELRGEMGNLNTTAKTFALRGITVWYGGRVEYVGGGESSLANGRAMIATGVIAADRTRFEARRIEFK